MSQDHMRDENVVSISRGISFRPSVRYSTKTPESVTSCLGSTFESSWQQSGTGEYKPTNQNRFATAGDNQNEQFEMMKGGQLGELFASTDMLFHSGREEHKKMKAVFGTMSGIFVGALLFILLFYSFEYSAVIKAIFTSVSTVFICIGLAFFPSCRCIMALVIPNFSTGKGRGLFLSIIFAGMFAGPILNITHNGKEIGNGMACMIDLIANQSKIILHQSKESAEEVIEHIEQQRKSLETIKNDVFAGFKELRDTIDALDNDFEIVDQSMNKIFEECRGLMKKVQHECYKVCFFPLTRECRTVCNTLTDALTKLCSPLKIGGNIADVTKDIKDAIDQTERFFNPAVKVEDKFDDKANYSEEINMVQKNIDKKIKDNVYAIQTVIATIKYALSMSLLLMFIQAFLYFRNYMAKEGYDNMYITKEFIELDKKKADNGEESLLPLKKVENSEYIHTRSLKLTKQELQSCKTGLAHVLIHALICFVVVLFDYFLYYILNLIQKFGEVDINLNHKHRLLVDVRGQSFVVKFYKEMLKGINIDQEFHSHLALNKCLPNPSTPSGKTLTEFLMLYLIALCFVVLRGYGMRMRRTIAAYYYPEVEASRMEYLHKTIRHRRVARQRFLRQEIKSAHKENSMKKKFRLSTWFISKCPCIAKLVPSREQLECTSCEDKQGMFGKVTLTKCTGVKDDVVCTAMYCHDCRVILQGVCPLCYQEEIDLRD